jgi:two-component system NtrC family response regulator
MEQPRLLVVEDDEAIRTQLKYALQRDFSLSFAHERGHALASIKAARPQVILLDLGLPPHPDTPEEGLKLLEELPRVAPAVKVVVLTGNSDRDNASRAMQLGAFDYLGKPIDVDVLKIMLLRGAFQEELEQETESRRDQEQKRAHFEEILGTTPTMRQIFTLIQRVAKADATVLIQGESGTGKELIARAIHQRSNRLKGPFVPINCGAIPETLLESELFGHERGAFTGAHIQRMGKLEQADGGTLFLDEIGELSLPLQVKLLRFLQERTVERIGGRQSIHLNLRVIAATHQNLRAQLERGLLREDLFYRISVVTIQVPPLRERGEDIILMANAFLRRGAPGQRPKLRFSSDGQRALMAYPWPGNVRELENKVSRAMILAHGHVIEPADLDLEPAMVEDSPASLREVRSRAERDALVEALNRYRGNISQAAQQLRISRPTFHGLLEKHQINAKQFR